jgi:CheY-like chemotaxis protein
MPHLSGRELATTLSAERPDTRLLFMSAYAENAVQQHGLVDVTEAFVQKPFLEEVLLRHVALALDSPPRGPAAK